MIPHSRPSLAKAEEEAVQRVLRSGMLAQGAECEALEADLATYLSAKEVVVVSSGSAALHLALLALGVGTGDTVALPSFVCSALLNAARHVQANPSLVDLPGDGYNIQCTDLPLDANAAIVPHMFGKVADLEETHVPVVEDCAMAIGATSEGRKAGTVGKLGIFSFYATKVLCAGEGGAVATNEPSLAAEIRDLRDYDGRHDGKPRYNYKMTDVQAAIARVQLSRLDDFIKRRWEIADLYNEAFDPIDEVTLPDFGREDIPFRYVIGHESQNADQLIAAFESAGIAARRPVFAPLHEMIDSQSAFTNTDRAYSQAVSIPLYPSLRDDEVRGVIEAGKRIF